MSKGQEGSEATRIEEGGNDEGEKGKRKKKCKTLALARDRFSSLLLSCVFLRNPEEARPAAGFCPSRTREDGECQPALPSLSLPSRDSSQFFFELFVSNFTSPPCHVASSFFFPVCPSAIRGVDERARSSCFTSLACPPLSALLPSFLHLFLFFSPFLRSFALLIHFTTVVSSPSILRPPFSCLSVVSSLLPRALRSPPPPAPPLFSAPASSFPSFAAYVGSIYSFPRSLFSPDRLRRYFLVAPSLPWLYATLLSSPSPSFLPSSLTPTGREKQPPLSLARSSLYHRPDSILLSFSPAFSFSPSSIHLSIFLFLSLPYPRAPLSLYFFLSLPPFPSLPLLLPAAPLTLLRQFFLRGAPFTFFQRYRRRLLASSRTFPFRGHYPRDDGQPALSPGKRKRKRPSLLPPFSFALSLAPLLQLPLPSCVSRLEGLKSSRRVSSVLFFRGSLSPHLFLLFSFSLSFFLSFAEMRMIKETNKICMTTGGFCIKHYTVPHVGPSDLALL